jgi:hypothetical protein
MVLKKRGDAKRSTPYQPASLLSSELIGVDQLLSSILCGERAGMKYC